MKRPSFFLRASSLGLSVGVVVGVFAAVEYLLDRPPTGVRDPDRVVFSLLRDPARQGVQDFAFSFPQYERVARVQDGFESVAAYSKIPTVVSRVGPAEQVVLGMTTPNFFELLGLSAARGRVFASADRHSGIPEVVISHRLRRMRFAEDETVVGQSLTVNGHSTVVAGVLPPQFEDIRLDWNGPADVWVATSSASGVGYETLLREGLPIFLVIGRLERGLSVVTLNERTASWIRAVNEGAASSWMAEEILYHPIAGARLGEAARQRVSVIYGGLLTMSVLLVLGGCFFVSNMSWLEAMQRRRSMRVRIALGATPGRILGSLAAETLALTISATTVALLVAEAGARTLLALVPSYLQLRGSVDPLPNTEVIGWPMLSGTVGVVAICSLIFGLGPALAGVARQSDLGVDKRSAWPASGLIRSPRGMAFGLQIAASVLLLVLSGLYLKSFARASAVDPGLRDPAAVMVARVVTSPGAGDLSPDFYDQLLARIESQSNVISATIGWNPPFGPGTGEVRSLDEAVVHARITAVGPRFFETQGISILNGAEFDGFDEHESVVVNEVLARALWGRSAVAGEILVSGGTRLRVAAVAAADACAGVLIEPEPCMWRSFPRSSSSGYLRVRTRGNPHDIVVPLEGMVQELDPNVAVAEVRTLDQYVARQIGQYRLSAIISAAFAGFALLLAALNCVALFVAQVRTCLRELAIRTAVWATRQQLAWHVGSEGLVVTGVAIVLGAALSAVVAHRLGGQFFEVSPMDPWTYAAASVAATLIVLGSIVYAVVSAGGGSIIRHLQHE